ncbi:MAG TPA: imidazolonepropionase [Actinomycetota bacterium]|nr:imidazolonepropionase [Actinomycetota bacterium]
MSGVPHHASGAIAATNLVTPSGDRAPVRGDGPWPTEAAEQAVAWEDGVITYVGQADGLTGVEPEWFEGCTIAPGFVDCHTHLPFAGWRADEFEARLSGLSYRDLHGEGGIYRSARMLAAASEDEVLAFCRSLVQEMAEHGTTALELKTGYGLSVEAELRQARLARRLSEEAPQTCSVTLLACHAVPEGMERADWVRVVCDELIPAAARERLVDAVDVYVEDIAFSVDDLAEVAGCASDVGLPLRCHADQLGPSGAAEAAVALAARSADHLNHVSATGIAALGGAPTTVAVLLPTSTLFLGSSPPDVRALLDAGAAVAIATDFNPGTSPVLSMPEAIATACSLYGLQPLEALAAATVNASAALGLAPQRGTLAPGRPADLVVLDGDAFRMVPYRPGHNPVVRTFVDGERVGGR